MRLRFAVLVLSAAVFLANVEATETFKHGLTRTSMFALSEVVGVESNRNLRTVATIEEEEDDDSEDVSSDDNDNEDEEERGGGLPGTSISKITSLTNTAETTAAVNAAKATALARAAEAAKVKEWLQASKPVDEVFTVLKLDQAGDDIFSNPNLALWRHYAVKFDEAKRNNEGSSMISTLRKYYDDEDLLKLITAARFGGLKTSGANAARATALARAVEAAKVKEWLQASKPVDEVFTVLKLDQAGDDIFSNPNLALWRHYAETFDEAKRNNEGSSMISTLRKYYGDEDLLKLITAARFGGPKTSGVSQDLTYYLCLSWAVQGLSKSRVSNLMYEVGAAQKVEASWIDEVIKRYNDMYSEIVVSGRSARWYLAVTGS